MRCCDFKNGFSHLNMLQNILHLDLSCCFDLKNDDIQYLQVLNLLSLNISGCYSITDEAIIYFNKCKKLKYIDLRYTYIERDELKNIRPDISYDY
jgi:hypothetical protein